MTDFDICVQNINKQWWKDGKLKNCPLISDWQKSMTNMIWWSLATSIGNKKSIIIITGVLGDSNLAREKILSIFGHITGLYSSFK